MTDSIAARLAALPQTSTHDLKALWTELYDKPAPAFSRAYLISRLAYRIQELHFGGLKPATRARLDALADGLDPKQARKRAPARLIAGTRLCREWQGVEHVVTVLHDGGSTTRAGATTACRPSPAPSPARDGTGPCSSACGAAS